MQGIDTENTLAQHTENKLAQPLCDFCGLQPATIQCYTCLMYLCGVNCHILVYDPVKDYQRRHQYIKDFRDTPTYVNCECYHCSDAPFDKWILERGAKHSISLMSIDKFKQQSTVILDSIPKFIPELANIVNEYIATKATVGLFLDFLDFAQRWCVGQIIQIQGEIALIRIKKKRFSERLDEWVQFKSKRLAPLHSSASLYF